MGHIHIATDLKIVRGSPTYSATPIFRSGAYFGLIRALTSGLSETARIGFWALDGSNECSDTE